jgi:hypothetical protein
MSIQRELDESARLQVQSLARIYAIKKAVEERSAEHTRKQGVSKRSKSGPTLQPTQEINKTSQAGHLGTDGDSPLTALAGPQK